ncbi:hypothetical protein VTU32_06530 [Thermoanaerobacter sp. CM-CNRG TB177]|uniref:hypothetical protein n=1 Tax=Thermoanaerobacter sp. CM-CNRG TB177 TaxID=2800659 RepID=UPI001BDF2C9D|nr:hypothetical protein [Thermoanaerobacter sp. CM-CNRG TB177]MBT1278952.1 hypothetical protein [Thermoanaerobacter sp. CM-CNRG TB177]
MKLSLYQKNIMLRAIKNKKIDGQVKILFLIELLYYNAISLKVANTLLEQYISVSEDAEENLKELLKLIAEGNITLEEIKGNLAQNVLTEKLKNIEAKADVVYMLYDKKGTAFLLALAGMVLAILSAIGILSIF